MLTTYKYLLATHVKMDLLKSFLDTFKNVKMQH